MIITYSATYQREGSYPLEFTDEKNYYYSIAARSSGPLNVFQTGAAARLGLLLASKEAKAIPVILGVPSKGINIVELDADHFSGSAVKCRWKWSTHDRVV